MFRSTLTFFCNSSASSAVNPALRKQYFAFLGYAVDMKVDGKDLQKRLHAAQKIIHPDKQVAAAQVEKKEEEGTAATSSQPEAAWLRGLNADDSATANSAYETLRQPFLRAKYISKLLRANGAKISEVPAQYSAQDAAAVLAELRGHGSSGSSSTGGGGCLAMKEEDSNVSLAPEFLMDMMDLNEELEGCSFKTSSGKEGSKAFQSKLNGLIQEHHSLALTAWEARQDSSFHDSIHKWTYFERLKERLGDKEMKHVIEEVQ